MSMPMPKVLSGITAKAKKDGLDLKVEKGRPIPGKEEENYYIIKSKGVDFVNSKKCEVCGRPVRRICRVVYEESGETLFKDICDFCYNTEYKINKYKKQTTLHSCTDCTCKEKG